KKLTITVERDRSVVVHAPASASDESIKRAVESKKLWIYEKVNHKQKYKELPHPPGKELVNGESALYLGQQYQIEIFENQPDNEIHFDNRFTISFKHGEDRKAAAGDKKGVMREWYISKAQDVILPRVDSYAQKLGVKFNNSRIVNTQQYRWGSCSVKDNLNFNWRLIKAPIFVIDYIIVHELAHLLEANHTSRFWNIVKAQIPNLDKAKNWLNENGQLLEEEI
ncbi:MAG: M48 family metallopeptidase, partial [Desulfamplus sp.]|nr:M48 family metallopeptidase [Desulfamplus sp.]